MLGIVQGHEGGVPALRCQVCGGCQARFFNTFWQVCDAVNVWMLPMHLRTMVLNVPGAVLLLLRDGFFNQAFGTRLSLFCVSISPGRRPNCAPCLLQSDLPCMWGVSCRYTKATLPDQSHATTVSMRALAPFVAHQTCRLTRPVQRTATKTRR